MDLNHDNDVVVIKTKKKKSRPLWTDTTHMIFLELCLNEVRNGNKPTGYFNKSGKANLEKYMKERTGITLDQKQIKNHWESMKIEWKLYDRLMRIESGIGWDPVRKTIDASADWWDEKIKGDKDLAKLRGQNLEMYKVFYEPLFRDCVAVGDNTKTPSEFQNMSGKDEDLVEGKGDSDEINDEINVSSDDQEPIFPESSSTKRKKSKNVAASRSTKGKTSITSAFEDKLANVMQALSSRSSQSYPPQNSSPSTKECMDIVLTFPGFEEGSRNYCHALDIFLKKQARENFMVPTGDKYYVVDAGYPNTRGYLAPYKGTNIRYHIPDFRRGKRAARRAPRGAKETFNYHHSSLRNVIERTFGVWKARWEILQHMHVNYTYETQVKIVLASMAVHNYIRKKDACDDGFIKAQRESYTPNNGIHGQSSNSINEIDEDTSAHRRDDDLYMSAVRDMIAGELIQSR